jgi:urease accessory protein
MRPMIAAGASRAGAGSAGLSVKLVGGQSAATDVWCSSPIKLLTPRPRGPSVWAYLSSFGGGMVAGDQTNLSVRVGAGARCYLTTQASTKIYRNPARRPCSHQMRSDLEDKSLLVLVPDPVQSFADSSYLQSQQFHLHAGAGLVLVDWFSSGRAARGERWIFHRLRSRNDVFIDGRQCLGDSTLLDRAHGPLAGAHRLGRFNCVAMISIIGGYLRDEAQSALARIGAQPVARNSRLVFSGSAITEGALVRVAGEEPEEVANLVYDTLGFVAQYLQDDPWIRKRQAPHVNN